MKENTPEGVIVALITSFNRDGALSLKLIEEHVSYLLDKKVNGFFITGTTGFGPALSLDERKRVIDIVTDIAGDQVPVIAHVTSIIYTELIELIRYANKKEVYAVSVTTPYFYNELDRRGLLEYFGLIASNTNTYLYLYNQPKHTGLNISIELIDDLLKTSKNVKGIKDSSKNLSQLFEYIVNLGDRLDVFVGGDNLFYPALTLGAKGIVSGLSNIVPEVFVDLFKSYRLGDVNKALELQVKITKIHNILKKYPHLSGYYGAGRLLGLPIGYSRIPIRDLSSQELEILKKGLRALGLYSET